MNRYSCPRKGIYIYIYSFVKKVCTYTKHTSVYLHIYTYTHLSKKYLICQKSIYMYILDRVCTNTSSCQKYVRILASIVSMFVY